MIIREIIITNKIGEELNQYIRREAAKQIPQGDQKDFIEDLQQDLELMDESRIVGMSLDSNQLAEWMKKRN